ncbi:hypothetical protein ACQZ5G_14815 [Agrobacterium sp. 22-214-1]
MAQNKLWTDDELFTAVDSYIFLLRAERAGVTISDAKTARSLLSGILGNRNDTSVLYRMRNISEVVRELGVSPLGIYPPAENVGKNVAERIKKFLHAHSDFRLILEDTKADQSREGKPPSIARADVLTRLTFLHSYISDLERELLGIGHNGPPGALTSDGPSRLDFDMARSAIEALKLQISEEKSFEKAPNPHIETLMKFGLKVALWVGERATKFSDVTLKLLAPIVVAKATGLAPVLYDAVSAATKFFTN